MNAFASRPWLPVHHQRPGIFAGFWRRVVAWLIDAVILGVLVSFVGAMLGLGAGAAWISAGDGIQPRVLARIADGRLQSVGLVVGWLYYALCESSRWQATPGKLALALAVTDEAGRRVGFGRATARCVGMLLSALIFCVGFLMAAWTPRRQALHDVIAGCCVVRRAGLARWEQALADAPPRPAATMATATGMPAWAIALVVLACVVLAVPVIVIVGAVAIPAYQNHVIRSEVAGGLATSRRARALTAEYIGERGRLPADNGVLGLPEPEAIRARYVSSVRVAGGKVVVTYGNQANLRIRGRHVVMAPLGNAAMLRWQCSSPDIRPIFLPRDCRQ